MSRPSDVMTLQEQHALDYRELADRIARKAFYGHLPTNVDLHAWALDLVGIGEAEAVVDVGCGTSHYFEALEARGCHGPRVGVDRSEAMLDIARSRVTACGFLRADALALPMRDGCADVALVMHVLYDVVDQLDAMREVTRILRPSGRAAVFLNSRHNLSELNEIVGIVASSVGAPMTSPGWNYLRFPAEMAASVLGQVFERVVRRDASAELRFVDHHPVVSYLESAPSITALPADARKAVLDAAADEVRTRIRADGAIVVSVRTHCFICTKGPDPKAHASMPEGA